MHHRDDIDGLRAVSVLAVVLYHALPALVPHGYLGVDVFFVISGMVITRTMLANGIADGAFSVTNFYMRRVRRIIPALVTVCLATTVGAAIVLFPSDLIAYSSDLVSAASFVANIKFYLQTNYFSASAETNPLLHLWSLSVEEQFYILFPLLLLFGARFKMMLPLLTLVGFSSLAAYIWMAGRDPSAAFYLLPFRAWELMLGAVTAVLLMRLKPPHPISALLSWIGLAAILFAFMRSTPITPYFPQLSGVLACFGTAAVIAFNYGRFAMPALSLRPVVFVGLISYSLYLWHWPLFALSRYYMFEPVTQGWAAVLIAASFALAVVTWRYIEQPFRRGVTGWRTAICGAAIALSLLVGLGVALARLDGLPFRITSQALAMASFPDRVALEFFNGIQQGKCLLLPEQRATDFDPACMQTNIGKSVVFWGDSYAAHYVPGLKSEFARSGEAYLMQMTAASCPPVLNRNVPGIPGCRAINDLFFEKIIAAKPDLVVLSAVWTAYDAFDEFDKTLLQLDQHRIRYVVLGPCPVYPAPLPQILARYAYLGRDGDVDLSRFVVKASFGADREMKRRYRNYISIMDVMCPSGRCIATSHGDPVAVDTGHLSPAGSALIASHISDRILAFAKTN